MNPIRSEPPNSGRWYVVASKPLREETARENLDRQGYRTFLPRLSINKRRRGVWGAVVEPLFPGYLFVYLTLGEDDPAPVRSTLGCVGLIRSGKALVPVPDTVMLALLTLGNEPQEPAAAFAPGDLVVLEDGPFSGLKAVFEMNRGADRARVLIELLGRQQRLEVSIDQLSKH